MQETHWESSLAACTQPQCLLRDEDVGPEFVADLIIRLLAGEDVDVSKAIPFERMITYREWCRQCLLDVVREKGPLETVEELRQIEDGRRAHRRERRARRRTRPSM